MSKTSSHTMHHVELFYWFCNKCNTTGATCGASFLFRVVMTLRFPRGAGITKLSGAPEFTPVFSGGRVDRSLVFCVVFCRLLCVLLSFHFGIDVRFWLPLLYIQSFLSAIDC